MRFLHTADWHLGRLLHGERLTDQQAYVLDQIVAMATDMRPDAVLISGDIYDRAVPPPEAVLLLDDVLSRLVIGARIPVIMIAGNHDSPDRLGFGSRLLAAQRVYVAGALGPSITKITLGDGHGPVEFYALPYAEPPVTRSVLEEQSIDDHNSAMRATLRRLPPRNGARRVLLAHAFVIGGEESESERPLSVGGAGTVDASCFDGFSYVALGHLHRPQQITPTVHYSGSLMKYSFSEAAQPKGIQLVELDDAGNCTIEHYPLRSRYDVRCLEGRFDDLLHAPPSEDYLMVTLQDDGPVIDAMSRLRTVFPRLLHLRRQERQEPSTLTSAPDHRQATPGELFAEFYSQVTGDELTDEQDAAFAAMLQRMDRQEREAGS